MLLVYRYIVLEVQVKMKCIYLMLMDHCQNNHNLLGIRLVNLKYFVLGCSLELERVCIDYLGSNHLCKGCHHHMIFLCIGVGMVLDTEGSEVLHNCC